MSGDAYGLLDIGEHLGSKFFIEFLAVGFFHEIYEASQFAYNKCKYIGFRNIGRHFLAFLGLDAYLFWLAEHYVVEAGPRG